MYPQHQMTRKSFQLWVEGLCLQIPRVCADLRKEKFPWLSWFNFKEQVVQQNRVHSECNSFPSFCLEPLNGTNLGETC